MSRWADLLEQNATIRSLHITVLFIVGTIMGFLMAFGAWEFVMWATRIILGTSSLQSLVSEALFCWEFAMFMMSV